MVGRTNPDKLTPAISNKEESIVSNQPYQRELLWKDQGQDLCSWQLTTQIHTQGRGVISNNFLRVTHGTTNDKYPGEKRDVVIFDVPDAYTQTSATNSYY